ncbi:MAG: DUF1800 family protein [Bacteroidota bacterium]
MGDPRIKKSSYREFQGRSLEPILLKDDSKQPQIKRAKTSTGLTPYIGTWGKEQAAHLIKRCSFGVQKEELNQLSSLTMDEAVDLILTPNPIQNQPVNDYSDYGEDPHADPGETWIGKPYHGEVEILRVISLKNFMLKSYFNAGMNIHPKMTLFWHNIIPTQYFLIEFGNLSYNYFKILNDNALGNYKDIVTQVTTDPSMLAYLNGAFNVKEAPDENYARELQELFTVGKGPDSGYTESDVFEAARVLTGWTIDYDGAFNRGEANYLFFPQNHDTGDKVFSEFYGNRTISGKSGQDGSSETDELIDMILETQEAAKYICRRLYNFFVYHDVDESVETNVITPLADIFRSNNYDIQPVLSALFKSEHFYDTANIGAYVKNPLDHMVGLYRSFDTELPADITEEFDFLYETYFLANDLGMAVGDPPSVSGWQAYYQQPSFDKLWINSDTIINRARYQDHLIFNRMDVVKFASSLDQPSDPDELIIESNQLLQGIPLSEETISDLKSNLLVGQTDDYWVNAWNDYENNPENEEYRSTVTNRLQALFRQLFQLAEFQLT